MHTPSFQICSRTLVSLAAVAVVVAGCSREPAQTAAQTTTAITESVKRTVTPPMTPTACANDQLKLTVEGGDAGMGHRLSLLALTNAGTGACVVGGYPEVMVLDAAGNPLPKVTVERGPNNYLSSGSPDAGGEIVLAAGARAMFDLAWTVVPHEAEGETVCPTAEVIQVSMGADTPLTLAQSFTPCGGRVQVTPLRAEAAKPR